MLPDAMLARRPAGLARALASVRRAVLRRRRPLAAVLAGVAVVAGVSATREPPSATVAVAVAARDLPAGEVLDGSDVATVEMPLDVQPDDLAADPVGRVLAAPVARGEPLTAVRLVGPSMTAGRADLTALPVRLPDAAMVALLQVGDRVDLLAADPQAATADTVARDVTVLAIAAADDVTGATGLPGRLVVVGLAASEVEQVVDAVSRTVVTYAWSAR